MTIHKQYKYVQLWIFCFVISLLTSPGFARGDRDFGDILNLGRLPYLKDSKSIQISSYDTSGGNGDCRWIAPGSTLNLADIKGPGVITHIWVTIASDDKYFLRNIILKMYWDDEKEPSVLTPIGDFFGTGFSEYHHFTSYLVGMSSGGYYSYIPMPFRKSARIEVTNLTSKPVGAFYYHIDYQKVSQVDSDAAYFHAQFRRENPTTPAKDYTILEASGRGHFIGTLLNMQGLRPGNIGFLEGDEHVYVDGETKPSWTGTGTEDYFISGWYFNQGIFAAPFHGLTIKDEEQSKISAYRFHLYDTIPFTKSLSVSIEHGTENTEQADYSSVAYWYQTEPHKPFTLPEDRIPRQVFSYFHIKDLIEAESLLPTTVHDGGELMKQTMGFWSIDSNHQWSGGSQLFFHNTQVGNSVTFSIPVNQSGKYYLLGNYTKASDYGIIKPTLDNNTMGELFDGFNDKVIPADPVSYGPIDLQAGIHWLKFEIVDKNPLSKGYLAGFDGFLLQKVN